MCCGFHYIQGIKNGGLAVFGEQVKFGMDSCFKIQIEKKKWLFLVGLVALTHLFCQSLMLPYGNALLSLLPNEKNKVVEMVSESSSTSNLDNESLLVRRMKSTKNYNVGIDTEDDYDKEVKMNSNLNDDDFDFVEDEALDDVHVDMEEGVVMHNVSGGFTALPPLVVAPYKPLLIESVIEKNPVESVPYGSDHRMSFNERKDVPSISSNGSLVPNKSSKRKMRSEMPPKTITPINEMERLLVRHRARSRAMVSVFLDVKYISGAFWFDFFNGNDDMLEEGLFVVTLLVL